MRRSLGLISAGIISALQGRPSIDGVKLFDVANASPRALGLLVRKVTKADVVVGVYKGKNAHNYRQQTIAA